MSEIWSSLIFVDGLPRNPESQGSVERSNGVLENSIIFIVCMRDNNTSKWTNGLLLTQWGLNVTLHEKMKQIPC